MKQTFDSIFCVFTEQFLDQRRIRAHSAARPNPTSPSTWRPPVVPPEHRRPTSPPATRRASASTRALVCLTVQYTYFSYSTARLQPIRRLGLAAIEHWRTQLSRHWRQFICTCVFHSGLRIFLAAIVENVIEAPRADDVPVVATAQQPVARPSPPAAAARSGRFPLPQRFTPRATVPAVVEVVAVPPVLGSGMPVSILTRVPIMQ